MRKLRIQVLMHEDFVPPTGTKKLSYDESASFKTEYDVLVTLRDMGHEAEPLGVSDDLGVIRDAIQELKPHLVFNLLEEFHGHGGYVPFVLGYLELIRQPYTGCNPYGLLMAHNKVLAKKLLRYHRVHAPDFAVCPRRKPPYRPKRLAYPLIVKSATQHGSVGIAHASVVYDDDKLAERIAFVHEQLGTDAIIEEYIDGRELYVGVIGNRRLDTFPIWELRLDKLPEGTPRIATEKVKWDRAYQKRTGIDTEAARDIPPDVTERISRICRRVFRILGQNGYARIDLRLTPEGKVYVLESNPNPELAYGEDFAESADAAGIQYEPLLTRILNLGLRYQAEWHG